MTDLSDLRTKAAMQTDDWKFKFGQRVRKHSGSWWEGRVVGFYSTEQTPRGYDVQLDMMPNGPTQIYPEQALEAAAADEIATLRAKVDLLEAENTATMAEIEALRRELAEANDDCRRANELINAAIDDYNKVFP